MIKPQCLSQRFFRRASIRRATGTALLVITLAASDDAPAQATSPYPERPVRMIVPFQPGGAADFVARIIQPGLTKALGQSVIVENRPGASGHIGVEAAAKATPDGHTVLLGNVGTMAINPAVYPAFRPRPLDAFAAVTQIADVPSCLAVHASLQPRTLAELITYVKTQPGKLSYSASGAGSDSRLGMEQFMKRAGISIVMVNYKGGAGAAAAGAASGETQVALLSAPSLLPHVRQGRLRLLAVVAPRRLDSAPDTPTLAESGFPDITTGLWLGLYVPKAAPTSAVRRLHAATTQAVRDPDVGTRMASASVLVSLSDSPDTFRRFWKEEHDRWAKVVRDVGGVQD